MDPRIRGGNFREILQYRESMKKFDSNHRVLEICETSKPSECLIVRYVAIVLFLFKSLPPSKRKVNTLEMICKELQLLRLVKNEKVFPF